MSKRYENFLSGIRADFQIHWKYVVGYKYVQSNFYRSSFIQIIHIVDFIHSQEYLIRRWTYRNSSF